MMRFLSGVLFLFLAVSTDAAAHEIYLTPSCKQGVCYHPLLRNFEPPVLTKKGVLRRYESAFVERRCKPDESMDIADCRVKRPALDEFKDFGRMYVLCSTSNPTVIANRADGRDPKGKYLANFLDMTTIAQFQAHAYLEYFTVCHNWEPRALDESFNKTLGTLNYKPLSFAENQREFSSENDVLNWISQGSSGAGLVPSVKALEGKWYLQNPKVCKGPAGETEGLIVYQGMQVLGYETDCDIRSANANGNSIKLSMVCASEGTESRETEIVEFVNSRQIKRISSNGKRRYSSLHTRCP